MTRLNSFAVIVLLIVIIFLLSGCSLGDNSDETPSKTKAYYRTENGTQVDVCEDVSEYSIFRNGVEIACKSDNSKKTFVSTPIEFEVNKDYSDN